MRTRASGFGRAVKTPRSPGGPGGFGRPHRERFVTRTRKALKDSARDRADMARRRIAMKLRGHKYTCPGCGRTARSQERIAVCRARHVREAAARKAAPRGKQRTQTAPVKAKGREVHSCACGGRGCKGTYRNHLEFTNHARQLAEREERGEKRQAEQARRTKAVKDRDIRGGRPVGAPKTRAPRGGPGKQRTTKLRTPDERAEWHAHSTLHAAGRVDRDGVRVPHEPSPNAVRPRTRVAPEPH